MAMQDCFSDNVDAEGIWKLLKDECQTCDVNKMIDEGTKCEGCIFIKSSRANENKYGKSRIGCSTILEKYGIVNTKDLGKHQLFYFLYHPELKFKVPVDPENERNWFGIHHENGNDEDDRKVNLYGCFMGIHSILEKWGDQKKEIYKKLDEAKTEEEKKKIVDKFNESLFKALNARKRMKMLLEEHIEKIK